MKLSVRIQDLEVQAKIGVYEEEKKNAQPIYISLTFTYEATTAAESDDITYAKDYSEMASYISNLVRQRHYHLLEHLLKQLKEAVDHTYRDITIETIEIKKPNALADADYVSVRWPAM